MGRLGVTLPNNREIRNDEQVKTIIGETLLLYDQSTNDPTLARASYGLAVFAASVALNVTLRTAALLFENALVLRDIKRSLDGADSTDNENHDD